MRPPRFLSRRPTASMTSYTVLEVMPLWLKWSSPKPSLPPTPQCGSSRKRQSAVGSRSSLLKSFNRCVRTPLARRKSTRNFTPWSLSSFWLTSTQSSTEPSLSSTRGPSSLSHLLRPLSLRTTPGRCTCRPGGGGVSGLGHASSLCGRGLSCTLAGDLERAAQTFRALGDLRLS